MGGWSGWVAASRLGGFGSQALGWWLCPRIRAQQLSPSCPALSWPPGAECSLEAAFLSGLDCAAGPPLQAEHSLTWKTAHLLIWLSWVWAPNQGPRGILLPLRGAAWLAEGKGGTWAWAWPLWPEPWGPGLISRLARSPRPGRHPAAN